MRTLFNHYRILLLLLISINLLSFTNQAHAKQAPAPIIPSVENFRDFGGYQTSDGAVVKKGLVYRSNHLADAKPDDMTKIKELGVIHVYDLRTEHERKSSPGKAPDGSEYVVIDVLADAPDSNPAKLHTLMKQPKQANKELGDGKIEEDFKKGYREFVYLPSARKGFKELFLAIGDNGNTPLVFHCTTGKDRTGWASAALLTFLGVPKDKVYEDFLKSNQYIIPKYQQTIDAFVKGGGNKQIPLAIFGVKKEYLDASFDEMEKRYGTIENYFSEGLGIDEAQQKRIKEKLLKKNAPENKPLKNSQE